MDFSTFSASIGVVVAFILILLVSRSNSPARYRARPYGDTYYAGDPYAPERGDSGTKARSGGLSGVFIFAVGVLLRDGLNFDVAGTALMVIGGVAVVLALLLAIWRAVRT